VTKLIDPGSKGGYETSGLPQEGRRGLRRKLPQTLDKEAHLKRGGWFGERWSIVG